METSLFVYMAIEAFIFMLPIVKVFLTLGTYKEKVEKLEKQIEKMDTIDGRLTTIESKIDLLIDGKLKIENN
ncbi:MAG: hypothetical protein II411_01720 [Lachnospiraceae bacterium]|nr:hypothetical protein [Lachnospiraceae bacterium]